MIGCGELALSLWLGLSLGLFEFDGGHFFELLHRGELGDIFEAEAEQELAGGFVENGAANDLFATGRGDELAGNERAENAGRIDAANFIDFRSGDGLLVGNHGQRLERGQGELQRRLEALDKEADGVVALRLGGHAIAAGNFANLDTAAVRGIFGDELIDDLAKDGAHLAVALAS